MEGHDELLTCKFAGYKFITTPPQFSDQINFIFSCKYEFSEWVQGQDSKPPRLIGYLDQPPISCLVRVSRNQFSNFEDTCEAIEQELKGLLNKDEEIIGDMIEYAWNKAWQIVQSSNPIRRENDLNLHFDVLLEHMYCIPSEAVVGYENMETMSCSIFSEEFSVLLGFSSMPCSLIFHGDCIERWLSISKNCPLCRYERHANVLDG